MLLLSPEAAAAVLALLLYPARLTHAATASRVAPAVYTRFVALFSLGGGGQSSESPKSSRNEDKSPPLWPAEAWASQAEQHAPSPAKGPANLSGHSYSLKMVGTVAGEAAVITTSDCYYTRWRQNARFLPLLAFAMTVLSDFYLSSPFTS